MRIPSVAFSLAPFIQQVQGCKETDQKIEQKCNLKKKQQQKKSLNLNVKQKTCSFDPYLRQLILKYVPQKDAKAVLASYKINANKPPKNNQKQIQGSRKIRQSNRTNNNSLKKKITAFSLSPVSSFKQVKQVKQEKQDEYQNGYKSSFQLKNSKFSLNQKFWPQNHKSLNRSSQSSPSQQSISDSDQNKIIKNEAEECSQPSITSAPIRSVQLFSPIAGTRRKLSIKSINFNKKSSNFLNYQSLLKKYQTTVKQANQLEHKYLSKSATKLQRKPSPTAVLNDNSGFKSQEVIKSQIRHMSQILEREFDLQPSSLIAGKRDIAEDYTGLPLKVSKISLKNLQNLKQLSERKKLICNPSTITNSVTDQLSQFSLTRRQTVFSQVGIGINDDQKKEEKSPIAQQRKQQKQSKLKKRRNFVRIIESFFWSLSSGDLASAKRLLKDNRMLIFSQDCNGWSAIHHAIRLDNMQLLQYLLRIGADIDLRDNLGRTSLFMAVKSSNIKAVEILINHGANPLTKTDDKTDLQKVSSDIRISKLLYQAKKKYLEKRHTSKFNNSIRSYQQLPSIKHIFDY